MIVNIDHQNSNNFQEISSPQLTHINSFNPIFLPDQANLTNHAIFPDALRNPGGCSTCFTKGGLLDLPGRVKSLQ